MPSRHPVARADAVARVVLERYLGVRRGESVTVESWTHALPWARALVLEARRRGAVPMLVLEDEETFFRSIASMGAAVVPHVRPPAGPRGGAHVYLGGPAEFGRLLGLPFTDRDRLLARHDPRWWAAARRDRTRAVRLAVADATPAAAALYEVDRDAWEAELVRASLVDPSRLAGAAARLVRALGRGRRLHLRHPNGTDLRVERADRAVVVDRGIPDPAAGAVWSRIPSGLVVLPLRPGAVSGRWESNRPSYDRFAPSPVSSGGRFTFDGGRLTEVEFDRGGEPFVDVLLRVGRHRVRAAALTVGVNPGIARAPELEALAEGTVGVVIADAPYRPDGVGPRFEYLASLADAEIDVDGRPWLRSGRPAGGRVDGRSVAADGQRWNRSAKASRNVRASSR